MDDFGAYNVNRVARVLKRKATLQARYQVSGPARRKLIKARLTRINNFLRKSGYTEDMEATAAMRAASGVDGIGGLEFQAMAPPGLGRLVRLPFYPDVANALTITSAGLGALSTTNPIFIEDFSTLAGLALTTGTHLLHTPAVSWATLRIVGFECQIRRRWDNIQFPGPIMLLSDLQIGGGFNLFTHEDFGDAKMYSADQPEFVGLRDYPILKSPNVAEVQVRAVSDVDPAVAVEQLTFSCALLCEVLIDDNHGAHVPGAYARKGAMVRRGGSLPR
jgi:hypothetical protein